MSVIIRSGEEVWKLHFHYNCVENVFCFCVCFVFEMKKTF